MAGRKVKHGQSAYTSEYVAWQQMKARCYYKRNRSYRNYGGRGIKVCERWMDFVNFFEDMGCKPGPGYSLDRINNNGNYEPGNCRWATQRQQSNNKRITHYVTIGGVKMSLKDALDGSDLDHDMVARRLNNGWPDELAVNTPTGVFNRWNRVPRPDDIPRDRSWGIAKGEDCGASKLTGEQVIKMRQLRKEGWSYRKIAARFSVQPPTASNAIRGLTWKHL